MTLALILLLIAVILFVIAAIPDINTGRVNLQALGLAFFAGSFLAGLV